MSEPGRAGRSRAVSSITAMTAAVRAGSHHCGSSSQETTADAAVV